MQRHKRNAQQLMLLANTIRQEVVRMLVAAQSGHTAGSLGMADVFATLYFHELRYDSKRPKSPERDFLFLSNGHICPVWYATLAEAGFLKREELLSFRKLGSRLQGHPHVDCVPGIENSGGPLGQGMSQAAGCALAFKRDRKRNRVYCVCGDGELDEGQAWEAALFAAHNKLDNMVLIVDRNNIQIDGKTSDILDLGNLSAKFRAFGWHALTISGHDINSIIAAFGNARLVKGKPTVIVAHTIPGRGTGFNDYTWHGKPPSVEEGAVALKKLQRARKRLEGSR